MWKLGRILGIDVSLHWTLFLFVAWSAFDDPLGLGSVVAAATLFSAVFGCVLLHEFGHCLAARQFGIGTSSIVMLPIGGVASLDRMPRDPKQELWVAAAGPLVNVVIAGLLFFVRDLAVAPGLHLWLTWLMYLNVTLVLFNLLPAFPMDGGRIFRALSAMFLPYVTATNLAASVGRVVAVLLGIFGLLNGHLMMILIAGFVYFVGGAEARAVAANPNGYDDDPQRVPVRPSTVVHAAAKAVHRSHVFRAFHDKEVIQVIWDDVAQTYRYAPQQ